MRKPRKSSLPATPVEIKTYNNGDLVFAKVRGHTAWPARIEHVIPNEKNPALNRYTVFFYGTHQFSTCKPDELCMYADAKEAMKSRCKQKKFIVAMKEVEDNPDVSVEQPMKVVPKEAETEENENTDDEAEEPDAEEDEDEKPGSSQKKTKITKSATKKRRSKLTESEEDDSSSVERPVSKKRKINTNLRVKLVSQPKKGAKEEPVSGDEPKVEEQEENCPETKPSSKPMDLSHDDPESDVEDVSLEFREPEDENMPDDERIVRRLIKNCIWESKNDEGGLEIVIRKMGFHFNEDKIKNWDSSELKEMIASERMHANEKIKDCLRFNPSEEPVESEVPEKKKEKNDLAEDSDEETDESDKDEGVFVKYFTRHRVDLMLQLKDLNSSPDYFGYVVRLAMQNPDNDFNLESQPLPLEEQRRLYTNEEKYLLLSGELRDLLPKGKRHDTKTAIALLENLMDVELTKVMICKYPHVGYALTALTKYQGSGNEQLSEEEEKSEVVDAEIIRNLALEIIMKLQSVALPEDWKELLSLEDAKLNGQVNGEDQAADKLKLQTKGLWMLHDVIHTYNLTLGKAAEGSEDDFAKILQPPIVVHMTKLECRKLKTMVQSFKTNPYCRDREATFRVCALARSLHPWSDVPAESFLPVLLKREIEEKGTKDTSKVVENGLN